MTIRARLSHPDPPSIGGQPTGLPATPVRVLLITGSLGYGGIERYTWQLLNRFDRSLVSPTVALLDATCVYPGGIPDDVEVFVVADGRRAAMHQLRKFVSERGIDVVATADLDSALLALGATLGRRHVRRITGHQGLHLTYTRKRRWASYLADALASGVMANSRAAADRLSRRHRRQAHVVHNGIDLDRLSSLDRDASRKAFGIGRDVFPLIGTVGRLDPAKGLDVLLDAFLVVRASHPGAVLLVVGDGPLSGVLRDQALRLGIADAVRFTGGRSDALDVYPGLDLFVLTSAYESFPNVLLEAQAHGCPVVATAVGGIPELITDNETGWLTPPGDAVTVGGRIVAALADDDLRLRIAGAGRRRVHERFSLEGMVNKVERIVLEMPIHKRPRRRPA